MAEKLREIDFSKQLTTWDGEAINDEKGKPFLAKDALFNVLNVLHVVPGLTPVEKDTMFWVGRRVGRDGTVQLLQSQYNTLKKIVDDNKLKNGNEPEQAILSLLIHGQVRELIDEAKVVGEDNGDGAAKD